MSDTTELRSLAAGMAAGAPTTAGIVRAAADDIDALCARVAALEAALRDVLRYGEHEGPCDNEWPEDGACTLHVAASDRRHAAALAVLSGAPALGKQP